MSGLDVLRKLRGRIPHLPLLLPTAKDSVEDRIAGLTAGGDGDYVTRAVRPGRSGLRLRAHCCRADGSHERDGRRQDRGQRPGARRGQPRGHLRRGPHLADRDRIRAAAVHDAELDSGCSAKAQILDRVWSYDFGGRSNIVEAHTCPYLRKKIDGGREPMIHTLRGAGYVLKPAR